MAATALAQLPPLSVSSTSSSTAATTSSTVAQLPQTVTATSSTVSAFPPTQFNPAALVGIFCEITRRYDTTDSKFFTPFEEKLVARGTGVIIDKRGYVLTNKHVGGTYIQKATTTSIFNEVVFTITTKAENCVAGGLPADSVLPNEEEIKSFNPMIRIPPFPYTLETLAEPSGDGWTNTEKDKGDFTIMKITGLTRGIQMWGVTSTPKEFPYATLIPSRSIFREGMPVLSYGAPGDVTEGRHDDFSVFYVLGAAGRIEKLAVGDGFFTDVPLETSLIMEISQGRSGSPVLWNGYVIGIIQSMKTANRTRAFAVSSDAILKYLHDTARIELNK
jgi:S1-C subfamily serine protease